MIRVPVFIFFAGVTFAAANYALEYVTEKFDTPPIKIVSGEIDGSHSVKPGSGLRVKLIVSRARVCHTVVARYIHSPAGEVVAYQEFIGGDAPIGTSHYSFSVPVPNGLTEGRYTFKGVVNSTCGSRRYVETTPALVFSITPS